MLKKLSDTVPLLYPDAAGLGAFMVGAFDPVTEAAPVRLVAVAEEQLGFRQFETALL